MQRELPFAQRNVRLRVIAAKAAVEEAVSLGAERVDDKSCIYATYFYSATHPTFSWKTQDRGEIHVTFPCNMGSAYQNAYETLPLEVHRCLSDREIPIRDIRRSIGSSINLEGRVLRESLRESVKTLIAEIENRP